jgi:hypothetical protein
VYILMNICTPICDMLCTYQPCSIYLWFIFTTLSVAHIIQRHIIGLFMSNELEWISKEAIVT